MKHTGKIAVGLAGLLGVAVLTVPVVSAYGPWAGDCPGYGRGAWMDGQGPMGMNRPYGRGMGMGPGMMQGRGPGTMMGARLSTLKERLQITEAQEPSWNAFETAVSAKMEQRMARRDAAVAGPPATVEERVARIRERTASGQAVADAMEKLYGGLTPEQQKIADQYAIMGPRW